ncbi:MAG TPA: 30S ribosomal protein S21 [Patescibacteria group bacterium]|nr:30S ribosomal protein S21 [Patescibacteria group bacterium]
MAVIVKAGPGESTDQVIRKFKKKILQNQLLTQLKDLEFYKKPSVRKKEKMAEFKRRKKRRQKMKWGNQ